MAYTKQTWNTGDTITEEKLNHMEDGIADATSGGGGGSGVLVLHGNQVGQNFELDKTYQEIYDYMAADGLVVLSNSYGGTIDVVYVTTCTYEDDLYCVYFSNGGEEICFVCDNTTDYPVLYGQPDIPLE